MKSQEVQEKLNKTFCQCGWLSVSFCSVPILPGQANADFCKSNTYMYIHTYICIFAFFETWNSFFSLCKHYFLSVDVCFKYNGHSAGY